MADVKLRAVIEANASGLKDALKDIDSQANSAGKSFKDTFGTISADVKTAQAAVSALAEKTRGLSVDEIKALGIDFGALESSIKSSQTVVSDMVNHLAELRKEASQVGTSFEDWQMLSKAAEQAGVDMGTVKTAMSSVLEQVQNLANGVPDSVAAFGRLGLTIEQLGGMSAGEKFAAISNAIQSTVSPVERARASMEMYRTSIEQVSGVSQNFTNIANNSTPGTFVSDRDLSNATGLESALNRLAQSMQGMTNQSQQMNSVFGQSYIDARAGFDAVCESIDRMTQKETAATAKAAEARMTFDQMRQSIENAARARQTALSDTRPFAPGAPRGSVSGSLAEVNDMGIKSAAANVKILNAELQRLKETMQSSSGTTEMTQDFDRMRQQLDGLEQEITEYGQLLAGFRNTFSGPNMSPDMRQMLDFDTGKITQTQSLIAAIRAELAELPRLQQEHNQAVQATNQSYRQQQGFLGGFRQTMRGVAGQVLGLGSAAAIISKAINIWIQRTKQWINALEDAKQVYVSIANVKGMQKVSDENRTRTDNLRNDLVSYRDTWRKANRPEATYEDKEELRQAGAALERNYGIDLSQATHAGGKHGVDVQIQQALKTAQSQRLGQVESELEMLRKSNSDIDEYTRTGKMSDKLLAQTVDRSGRIKSLSEVRSQNESRIEQLMTERSQLKNSDWAGDYQGIQNARTRDWNRQIAAEKEKEIEGYRYRYRTVEEDNALAKKIFDMNLRTATTVSDVQQAYEDYAQRVNTNIQTGFTNEFDELQRWLTGQMTGADANQQQEIQVEYQRRLQLLLDKYNGLQEDLNAAMDAHRKELIDEWKSRRDSYRDAWKSAQDAQKSYVDAWNSLAKTQRDIAVERKREREEDRRRHLDRQKRKARFGFEIPDYFRPNESRESRLQRKRNIKTDASIAEKMDEWESGKKVRFTRREQSRIDAAQDIRRELNRMDRTDRHRDRAMKHEDQKISKMQAERGLWDAGWGLQQAARDLNIAGLNLASIQFQAVDYSSYLGTLHTDFQQLFNHVKLVK